MKWRKKVLVLKKANCNTSKLWNWIPSTSLKQSPARKQAIKHTINKNYHNHNKSRNLSKETACFVFFQHRSETGNAKLEPVWEERKIPVSRTYFSNLISYHINIIHHRRQEEEKVITDAKFTMKWFVDWRKIFILERNWKIIKGKTLTILKTLYLKCLSRENWKRI